MQSLSKSLVLRLKYDFSHTYKCMLVDTNQILHYIDNHPNTKIYDNPKMHKKLYTKIGGCIYLHTSV